ncbi:MAG: GNAT family N-acetyltransferase, partial [Kurthia sp.]
FADLTLDGYIDRIYVHKDYQNQKIASQLLEKLEGEAYQLGLMNLETDASVTALPFFSKHGFQIRSENIVMRKNVQLPNYSMYKEL